jgi:hypothetical protein
MVCGELWLVLHAVNANFFGEERVFCFNRIPVLSVLAGIFYAEKTRGKKYIKEMKMKIFRTMKEDEGSF